MLEAFVGDGERFHRDLVARDVEVLSVFLGGEVEREHVIAAAALKGRRAGPGRDVKGAHVALPDQEISAVDIARVVAGA